MKGTKTNFRNFLDCEKALYKNGERLLEGKITPSQANSFAKICDSWVRTHKLKDTHDIIKRISQLEAMKKVELDAKRNGHGIQIDNK